MEIKRASGVQSSIADSEIDFEVDRLMPKIPPVRNQIQKGAMKSLDTLDDSERRTKSKVTLALPSDSFLPCIDKKRLDLK